MRFAIIAVQLICFYSFSQMTIGQNMFPGAEGFGSQSRGAYAGDKLPEVVRVTNLNDGGPGSLRAAINKPFPRVIIFEVSGVVELKRTLRIHSPYVHIAGQTAPYPGITLKNYPLGISSHDVLVQGLKIRPGIASGKQIDAINIADDAQKLYNIVVDHCSVSWALDENIGILNGGNGITISNCIISEGLTYMDHSMGLLAMDTERISILKNLFIHNADRNPLLIGDCKEGLIANNVIYNSDTHAVYLGFKGEKDIAVNAAIIGNLYIQGIKNRNEYLLSINVNVHDDAKVYLEGNKTDGVDALHQWSKEMIHNPSSKKVNSLDNKLNMPVYSPIAVDKLKDYIIANCGAHACRRDSIDARLIIDLETLTGQRIKRPSDVGGWPKVQNYRILELPEDIHLDDDDDGFTNLQDWLHRFM